jgi:hypothetical protein
MNEIARRAGEAAAKALLSLPEASPPDRCALPSGEGIPILGDESVLTPVVPTSLHAVVVHGASRTRLAVFE